MKIAVIQPKVRSGQIKDNLSRLKGLYLSVEADLVLAPELALLGYPESLSNLDEHQKALEELEGVVKDKGASLLLGVPYYERDKIFNGAFLLSPEGCSLVGTKVNLFPNLDEKLGFSPGHLSKPLSLGDLRLGVVLCFDLRFPEISKRLALLGAQVLVVLALWPRQRIQHFVHLLRARAIENQVFVIGVNAVGDAGGESLGGHSMAIDPEGREIFALESESGVFTVDLEIKEIQAVKGLFSTTREVLTTAPEEKILPLSDLLDEVAARRQTGQKMVFTNGCFDLLHAGHVSYLFEARRLGDFLVVGLNSDRSLRRLKGPTRPIIPQEERALVLAALSCVDYVVIFDEDTPQKLIEALSPEVLVKGEDWPEEEIVGAGWVKSRGGKVVRLPFRYAVSTSEIIKRIKRPSP